MEVETTAGQVTLWGNLFERKLWRIRPLLFQMLTSNTFRSLLESVCVLVCVLFFLKEALNAYCIFLNDLIGIPTHICTS